MNREASRWDDDYGQRGHLWGGAVHTLPAISFGSRVLELGCGNGKTFSALVRKETDVVAIDFSSRAAMISNRVAQQTGRGSVAIADARQLPFCRHTFDAVVASHVIGHMNKQDRYRVVSESIRVLSGNGMLWFSGFSREDLRYGKGREVEPSTFERNNGICTHYFTESEVLALFSGLVPVSVTTERWAMRVRGNDHIRAEITGLFKKNAVNPPIR
jgi:ubiquinone/menaquinone biosynthesis C-methylase UbiE